MKISSKTNKKNRYVIAIVLTTLVVLFGAYSAVAHLSGLWPFTRDSQVNDVNTIDFKPPTAEQIETGNDIKDAAIEAESAIPPTGEVTLTITAANQNENVLQIRTLIQATTNSGVCTLTLTMQGKVVTKTAPVQAMSSASTCAGFDIPVSELGKGLWSIDVAFENTTINGSASTTVEIK